LTGVLVGVLLLVTIVAVVGAVYVVARARSVDRQPGMPDELSEEVVTGLMAELRKWQAEAAHWKATAERLQRELDLRGGPPPGP
jgi:hypothetical protein